jgi:hypothetical protein
VTCISPVLTSVLFHLPDRPSGLNTWTNPKFAFEIFKIFVGWAINIFIRIHMCLFRHYSLWAFCSQRNFNLTAENYVSAKKWSTHDRSPFPLPDHSQKPKTQFVKNATAWLATSWTVRGSNPGGGEIFTPVHTGPGASYTMGTGSFPGVKRPGRGVNHSPLSSAEVKERVELYLYSPSGPSWSVLG